MDVSSDMSWLLVGLHTGEAARNVGAVGNATSSCTVERNDDGTSHFPRGAAAVLC